MAILLLSPLLMFLTGEPDSVSVPQTRSTPEVWEPKKSGLYKEQLSNKVWLFFPQKHLNLHLFGFQEKFESNRPGKFESNGPFEPIDVAQ
jgi:hypothetical protein